MSRQNNKIATQRILFLLFQKRLAVLHRRRDAWSFCSASCKGNIPILQPVATSSSGLGFRFFSPMASQSIPPVSSSLFLSDDDLPPSNQLEVLQIVPETMLPSARGNVAAKYNVGEYCVFFAAHVTLFLL
jgi:hypothetical protein